MVCPADRVPLKLPPRQSAAGTLNTTAPIVFGIRYQFPNQTLVGLTRIEGRMAMGIGRRRFLQFVGGAAAGWPALTWARRSPNMATVGFLMGIANDVEAQTRLHVFEQELAKDGWAIGRDIHIEYRFAAGDAKRMRSLANELVHLRPDVLVGHSTPVVRELVRATQTIPIVFVVVADPVGSGFVESIARPGRNATGFTNLDATITGKLLTILKQITPNLTRVALMLNPDTGVSGGLFYLRPFEAAAPSFAVEAIRIQVRSAAEIEHAMIELAREPNAGLIVMPDNFLTVHRQLIISLAARLRVPTVYPYRYFVEAGGVVSSCGGVPPFFRRARA